MTTGEFIQHLGYARGSLAECETEMLCAIRFGYVEENEIAANLELIREVGRLINGLIRSLSSLR
jgi:four helix bundle protein